MASSRDMNSGIRSLATPAVAALAFMLSGFGVLCTFWYAGSHPSGVPGLFDYGSATWGDGFFIPIMIGSLIWLIRRLPPLPRKAPTVVSGLLGLTAGLLVMWTWVSDPNPGLNWTLPGPHELNTVGIWHGVFLVIASATVSGLWVEFFRRLRSAPMGIRELSITSVASTLAISGGLGYLYLAVGDSAGSSSTRASQGSMAALFLASLTLIGVLSWASRGRAIQVANVLAGALCISSALLLVTHMAPRVEPLVWLLPCLAALGAAVSTVAARGSGTRVLGQESVAIAGIYVSIAGAPLVLDGPILLLTPILLGVASVAMRTLSSHAMRLTTPRLNKSYFTALVLSVLLVTCAAIATWVNKQLTPGVLLDLAGGSGRVAQSLANLGVLLVGLFFGGVLSLIYRSDYEELKVVEGDPRLRHPDGRPGQQQLVLARRAWLRLVGFGVSALATMLALTFGLAPPSGWRAGRGTVDWWMLTVFVGAVLLLIPVATRVVLQGSSPTYRDVPPRSSRVALTGVVAVCMVVTVTSLAYGEWHGLHSVWILVQSGLLAAFAVECVLANGLLLNSGRVSTGAAAILVATGVSVLLVAFTSMSAAVWNGSQRVGSGYSLLAWSIGVLLIAVITTSSTAVAFNSGDRTFKTDYPPVNNALQDVFNMSALWLVLVWFPSFFVAGMPESTTYDWIQIFLLVGGFLCLFAAVFVWVLDANDTHVERQRLIRGVAPRGSLALLAGTSNGWDRLCTLPPRCADRLCPHRLSRGEPTGADVMMVRQLSAHTAMQNAIAVAMVGVTGVSLLGFLNELGRPLAGAGSVQRTV